MRYAVVLEKANDKLFGLYAGPSFIATGETVGTVEQELRAAVRFHLEGFKGGRSRSASNDVAGPWNFLP
jgi:hypothetical protein